MRDEVSSDRSQGSRAVILAGGRGSRLSPYTTVIPKPLLPVGDSAILEIVLRQLRTHGFTDVTLAVGYLSHLIEAILGDGSAHEIAIDYHREHKPLGTAGPLTNIKGLEGPFLMLNGDVLTTLDYRDLYRAHIESGSDFTIATHRRIVDTDYGVLHLDGTNGSVRNVVGYEEKPKIPYVVSMGVYMANPSVLAHIPDGEAFDVPDLVQALLGAGARVGSYLYDGYWLDIGRPEDYQRAAADYEKLQAGSLDQAKATAIEG
jgi:NDP-sugar pyrophosphorylase family protein